MQMTGEQRIAAPRQRVWEALNDPDVLRASIPGCQALDRDGDNRFVATAEVKIGPIGARFKGGVSLENIDAPNGYMLVGQGSGGIAGSAKGSAKVRLADDGEGTIIHYEVDAEVGGRMAQLGGPIIDATAKQLAAKFFARFGEVVTGGTADDSAAFAQSPTAFQQGVSTMPEPLCSPSGSAPAFPWGWLITLALAIAAGFLLGRSGLAETWVVAVILLTIFAAVSGFVAGKSGGGR